MLVLCICCFVHNKRWWWLMICSIHSSPFLKWCLLNCNSHFSLQICNDIIICANIDYSVILVIEETISSIFYARKQLLLSARLSHRNSVCLSVCPSVRPSVSLSTGPSHGWISQKRCKLVQVTVRDRARLWLITNKKLYTGSRLPPNSMTLDNLKRQNRGFYGCF